LSRLCGASLYVINDAALAYMEERNLPQIVIGKFKQHKARIFSSAGDWERNLQALALSGLKIAPDPVLIASEVALWGAIRHQGLLPDTVIVSDDAGQFRAVRDDGWRTRCAGFMPNSWSISWSPPTTSSATPSRSPSE
jgi:hypothetical protein